MSKTYVIGVDDSGESSRVLKFALEMAKETNALLQPPQTRCISILGKPYEDMRFFLF